MESNNEEFMIGEINQYIVELIGERLVANSDRKGKRKAVELFRRFKEIKESR